MPSGWLGLDWGNVPSWVGAVLTGSSLGLAAVTYYRAAGDRRRQLDETERSGAARVSLWWLNPRKAMVRNSNDVAVTVQAVLPGTGLASERLGLGPGETRGLLLDGGLGQQSPDVALVVVDAYGRRWIRHADGRLERLGTAGPDATTGTELRWEAR